MARKASKQSLNEIIHGALRGAFLATPRVQPGWSVGYQEKLTIRTMLFIKVTRLGAKGDGGAVDLYAAIKTVFKVHRIKNPFVLHCDTLYNWNTSIVAPDTFQRLKRDLVRKRRAQDRRDG